MNYVLYLSYYYAKQHQNSVTRYQKVKNNLTPELLIQTQFLLTDSYLALKQPDKAEKVLGDINQYRENGTYVKSLYFKSRIKQGQNNPNLAIRTLLRIYYLPKTKKINKYAILLKITDIYLKSNNPEAANKYWKDVHYNSIRKVKPLKDLYFKLKSEIIVRRTKKKEAA